jgi:hypothetical protein
VCVNLCPDPDKRRGYFVFVAFSMFLAADWDQQGKFHASLFLMKDVLRVSLEPKKDQLLLFRAPSWSGDHLNPCYLVASIDSA